ncbi:hypothetical protein C8R43DRAFT_1200286 [Mycena crocata]|nr:hypothetical protein C8R43DRAFT_1200286 [Mycena crocata]
MFSKKITTADPAIKTKNVSSISVVFKRLFSKKSAHSTPTSQPGTHSHQEPPSVDDFDVLLVSKRGTTPTVFLVKEKKTDPRARPTIGQMKNHHKYFAGVDWAAVARHDSPVPYVPRQPFVPEHGRSNLLARGTQYDTGADSHPAFTFVAPTFFKRPPGPFKMLIKRIASLFKNKNIVKVSLLNKHRKIYEVKLAAHSASSLGKQNEVCDSTAEESDKNDQAVIVVMCTKQGRCYSSSQGSRQGRSLKVPRLRGSRTAAASRLPLAWLVLLSNAMKSSRRWMGVMFLNSRLLWSWSFSLRSLSLLSPPFGSPSQSSYSFFISAATPDTLLYERPGQSLGTTTSREEHDLSRLPWVLVWARRPPTWSMTTFFSKWSTNRTTRTTRTTRMTRTIGTTFHDPSIFGHEHPGRSGHDHLLAETTLMDTSRHEARPPPS